MNATEQLRLYRTRHVIHPVLFAGDAGEACKVDEIRLVRGGSLKPWRHDPDEIKRLVKAAAAKAVLPSRPDPNAVEVAPGTFLRLPAREVHGMSRQLDLSGMPNREQLIAEARRRGMRVEMVRGTGEVRITGKGGFVTINNRRKQGTRALVKLLKQEA